MNQRCLSEGLANLAEPVSLHRERSKARTGMHDAIAGAAGR